MLQMLKIHRSDPQLIVQLRFSGRLACSRFLRAYREGALRAHVCLPGAGFLPVPSTPSPRNKPYLC